MSLPVRRLAELWAESAVATHGELDEVHELTAGFCRRPEAQVGVLSAAWRLGVEIEHRLNLKHSDSPALARARGAAVSARHASSLLLAELRAALHVARRPVVVLSELSASQRLFGSCDVVPPRGAVVVSLAAGADGGQSAAQTPVGHDGIRWGSPGRLAPFLEGDLDGVDIEGCAFLLAPLEIQTARLANQAAVGGETCGLLFTLAVLRCREAGRWDRAVEIADRLDSRGALRQALSRWTGETLESGRGSRFSVVRMVKRAFGS